MIEHTIDTGQALPVKQHPRRVPLSKIQEAEAARYTRHVFQVNPAKIFSIDLSNTAGALQSPKAKTIDDTLDALSGSKWYSTLDLKSGYHQVSVAPEDRPKTAFAFPGSGLWLRNWPLRNRFSLFRVSGHTIFAYYMP
jgi:hypothetical protein